MATCKICKKEFASLEDSKEYCPACRISRASKKDKSIQDRHLEDKQRRSTSE